MNASMSVEVMVLVDLSEDILVGIFSFGVTVVVVICVSFYFFSNSSL